MNRQLRAQLLLEEARALGIDVADLVAAATGEPKPVTVAAWIDAIAPTFTPATASTYRPCRRLTARLLGDRYLAELTAARRLPQSGSVSKTRTPPATSAPSRSRTPWDCSSWPSAQPAREQCFPSPAS